MWTVGGLDLAVFMQPKAPCNPLAGSCRIRSYITQQPSNSAALEPHISNQASLSAKAPGEAISLPKSGEGRTACLTVADCGQIAGFGDVSGLDCVGW